MTTEIRMDIGDVLGDPVQTSDGYWRFDARLTRSGVFKYKNADGTERVEYRPPGEVAKATASMAGIPFTLRHPDALLDATTASKHMVGAVLMPRFDGTWSKAQIIVHSAEAVDKMKAEGLTQTSQGYSVDYDPTPGITPDGVRYDGVQRNIRPNHQSAVEQARAGSDCKIRLDGASYTTLESLETIKMFKHADGTEFASQAALDAYTNALFARDEAKGRADAAEAAVPKEDVIKARLADRRKLERSAETVASATGKRLDGIEDLDDRDLKIMVIKMVSPEFDGKDLADGEIQGWYKSSLTQVSAKVEARSDSKSAERTDSVAGISGMVEDPRMPGRKGKGKKKPGPRGWFSSNTQRAALERAAAIEQ